MKNYIKDNGFNIILIVLALALGILIKDYLPETLATHWDLTGQPDGYSSKGFALLFLPLLAVVITTLLYYLPLVSPKGYEMKHSQRSIGGLNLALVVLFVSLHLGTVLPAYDSDMFTFHIFFGLGLGLFLILFGNYMGKVERNFFIGFRVPWALASEKNWRATHRFAGKALVIGGLVLMGITFVTNNFTLLIVTILLSLVLPVIYSFLYFTKDKKTLKAQ